MILRISSICLALILATHCADAEQLFSRVAFKTPKPTVEVPAAPPRVQRVHYTKQPPAIDGRIDDACWRDAEEFTPFVLYRSDKPITEQRHVRACFDQDHLYFAVVCEKDPGHELVTRTTWDDDGHIWEDDEVEIFLDPALRHVEYYQVIANANGNLYDARYSYHWVQDPAAGEVQFKQVRKTDKEWDSGATVKVSLEANAWIVEMAIPVASMEVPGVPLGARWGLQVTSANQRTGEWTNWVACDWHDPRQYGQLLLGEPRVDVEDISFGAAAHGRNMLEAAFRAIKEPGEYRLVLTTVDAEGTRQDATQLRLSAGAGRVGQCAYTVQAQEGPVKIEAILMDPEDRLVYYSVHRGDIPPLLEVGIRPYGRFKSSGNVEGKITVNLGELTRARVRLEAALSADELVAREGIPAVTGQIAEFGLPMDGLRPHVYELRVRLLDEEGAELAAESCAFGLVESPL